jgi:hypothetical protein
MRPITALTVAIIVATGLVLSRSLPAFAVNYTGNNSWTYYRLPWQHQQAHYMSQGYLEGNHGPPQNNWSGIFYSLDFPMNNGTPLLAITEGSACWIDDGPNGSTGLGLYIVQTAPGSRRNASGTDFFFYGHGSGTWISQCTSQTYVYQGQVVGWSGNSGPSGTPYHLHITLQNPGHNCFCGSYVSQKFPLLSGIQFDGRSGNYTDTYTSDSVMPGDDQTVPQPSFYSAIFNRWNSDGGIASVGSTRNNGGGRGVHG